MEARRRWRRFRSATLIRNANNVGFGRAVNQAVASSRAPLLLLLNPDCQLSTGATATLRAVLDAEPACAIVGPRILDPDGGVQGSARGDPDMLTGLFGRTGALRALMPFLPVAKRNVLVEDAARSGASSVVVDWLSGACLLVRRDAFLAAGGFDERFFMYWEDADLCRRLRGQGFTIRYVPGASAVHQVGRSSQTAQALVDSRIPSKRISVLLDPCRTRCAQPEAARRTRAARCALLVATPGVRELTESLERTVNRGGTETRSPSCSDAPLKAPPFLPDSVLIRVLRNPRFLRSR